MRTLRCLSCCLILALAVPAALAQTGAITGTVKDQSGAVVAGARITVTNVDTNAPRTAVTSNQGDYTVPLLQPGVYNLKAEFAGFKTGLAEKIKLDVNSEARIDFTLQLGTASEDVLVSDSAPLVQSETSSVGSVIDNQKVVELPLNGRNFASLAVLVPGTANTSSLPSGNVGGGFSAGGSRSQDNQTLLDGINDNDAIDNTTVAPIVDSIQEFKVLTSTYSAEFGRTIGGQVLISTKSGTNSFHGSAWEFLRNDKLDAKDYFMKPTPADPNPQKNPFKRNQYGGTVGGPIRKDKTFFFAAFEGTNVRQETPTQQSVPDANWLKGDFSEVLVSNGCNGPQAPQGPCIPQLQNPAGGIFPGGKIDLSLFSPQAEKFLALNLWPTANLPGFFQNWSGTLSNPTDVYNMSGRIDHRFSDKNTLFGRYSYSHSVTAQPCSNPSLNCVPNFGNDVYAIGQNIGVSDIHVFSSKLINEFHIGYNRNRADQLPITSGKNVAAELGYPSGSNPATWGIPNLDMIGLASVGTGNWMPHSSNTYLIGETITYNKGSQMIRAGFEGRSLSFPATQAPQISFTFTGMLTGNPFADFLLGLPTLTTQDPLAQIIPHQGDRTYAEFVEDDWQINNRLTLNLGLRYEYNGPVVEEHNRLAQVNVLTGAYEIAGQNGASRALYNSDWSDIEPRIGFAFRPTGSSKSVIRGGYGIFRDLMALGPTISLLRQNPPYVVAYTYGLTCGITLDNPFPVSAACGQPSAPNNLQNILLTSINPNIQDPLAQQWNLGYQHELGNNMAVDISYVGSKGNRVYKALDYNQIPLGGTQRPHPQYGAIKTLDSSGYSKYNALNAKFERRFAKNISLIGSYTYSHCIDNASQAGSQVITQNTYDQAGDEGQCDVDVRQRLALNYVYYLPFGKGQRFGNSMPTPLNWALGGWQFSGITQFQSGSPIFLVAGANTSHTGEDAVCPPPGIPPVGCDVPNVDLSQPRYIANGGTVTAEGNIQYLNTAVFSLPAQGTFGNMPRNMLVSRGIQNNDFVLSKNFNHGERFKVQFRAEMFNALNTPLQAAQFDRIFTDPTFGQITTSNMPNRQVEFGLKLMF